MNVDMKTVTIWSIAILLIFLMYLVATIIFSVLLEQVSVRQIFTTRTPEPTFTVTPTGQAAAILITPQPVAPTFTPSPTASAEPSATASPLPPTAAPLPTATVTPAAPQVVAAGVVNVRSGPGTNYPVVASLPANVPVAIIGQNQAGSWWQIQGPDGSTGWVAGSVVEARNAGSVPVVSAPPPPAPPTPIPQPTDPPRPAYQYEPSGWFGDTNYGLTRFLGTITDVNGNPVDGMRIEAQCGDFRVVSNPSGPVGDGYFNESSTWPPGFYDLTLALHPIPCTWFLTVVQTDETKTVVARLSEAVEVVITNEESVITANWRKNW